jgi:hypothetical protein
MRYLTVRTSIEVPLRAINTSSYSGCASRTFRYAFSACSACFTSGTTLSFLPFPCRTVISRLVKSISASFKLTSSLTRRPVCRKSITIAKSRVFPPKPRQNIVYLSAELNRLCRIRVSTDISIRGLSPVGGLILPLYSVVAHRNATLRVQSI